MRQEVSRFNKKLILKFKNNIWGVSIAHTKRVRARRKKKRGGEGTERATSFTKHNQTQRRDSSDHRNTETQVLKDKFLRKIWIGLL